MSLSSWIESLFRLSFVVLRFFIILAFNMLRRFSSNFRKGKKDDSQVNGKSTNGKITNGNVHNGAASNGAMSNGITSNGAISNGAVARSRSEDVKKPVEDEHSSAGRLEVESTFKNFEQLIHAARKPLPTQAGDGAYLDQEVSSGLFQDLKSLGFKDVKTLMQVMKTKATGEYQDDKTYLMENVIQVCHNHLTDTERKLRRLVSWSLACQIIPKLALT